MDDMFPPVPESEFELTPDGSFPARIIEVSYLGNLENTFPGSTGTVSTLRLGFELAETMESGKPFVIQTEMGISFGDKAKLAKIVKACFNISTIDKEFKSTFKLSDLMEKELLLEVSHKESGDKTYANATNFMKLPKGTNVPDRVNDTILFSVMKFDQEQFDKFPNFIQEKIESSEEYQARVKQANF